MLATNFDECIELIKLENNRKDNVISNLRKENKRLIEENYKDEELQKMKVQFEKMKADYWRGFPITEDEKISIEEWKKKHAAEKHGLKTEHDRLRAGGCIGGTWTYEFIPTSLDTIGYVKCNLCDEKFCFAEIK